MDFLFFERDEGSAVELFAAPGKFTEFSATDTWRLVGDTASGGLTVVTDPLPPTEITWQRAEPAAGLIFELADTQPVAAGDASISYITSLNAGQQLSVAATALQSDAQLQIALRDPSGNRTVAQASGPGQTVGLSGVRAVADGDYRLEISSNIDADVLFEANLNTAFELETINSGSGNDSIATAQGLTNSAIDLGVGVRRMAVQGQTDGFQLVQAGSGNVFAGNNLAFTFRNIPDSGGEDVALVVTANADLDGTNEFLTLDAEGVLTDELFVHEGHTQRSSTTSITITSEQWAALTADGRATFTITPSEEVSDFGATQLGLALQIGAAAGDHFQVALSQDEVATFALTGLSPGDISIDVIGSNGQVVARSAATGHSDRQVIPGFRAPEDGAFYVRVHGAPQVDYSLVATVGAAFDTRPDDRLEEAPDITQVAAVLGAVDGATVVGDEPDGTTPLRTFPFILDDGDGFQWDIQNDGSIGEGSDGAFNGGLRDFRFFVFDANAQATEDDGREVVLGPFERFDMPGIEVTRKIFVPENQGYARFLEIVSNTSNAATSLTVDINTNLGSDARTLVGGTSNGDAELDVDDSWLVTDDDDRGRGAPAITHVLAGSATEGTIQAFLFGDSLSYSYELELEPGQTQIIMHFAAQSDTQAEAITKAQLLTRLNLDALRGLSEAERSQIANFNAQDLADYFALQVNSGDQMVIQTETPQVGTGSLANRLDPQIQVFGPDGQLLAEDDNSAADGRNASLRFTATETGTYTASVTAAQGSGQYVLRTVGSTAPERPLTVIDSVPSRDSRVESIPHGYTVRLSSHVDVTSVSKDDLLINGRAALDAAVVDGDTLQFLVDPAIDVGQGPYRVQIATGAFSSVSGQPVDASSTTFFLDATPPRIASTTWNGAALPADRTLPVGSLVFSAELDEALSADFLGPEDVLISNEYLPPTFQPFGVFFDEATNSVAANFQQIPEGDYVLTLSSRDEGFEDTVGNDLDGEPSSTSLDGTVTGDGADGGDYSVAFRIDDAPHNITHRFQAVQPLGSLIRTSESTDTISFPGDVDTFDTYLVAGEMLELLLEPLGRSSTMSIIVRQPNGSVMTAATATGAGENVYLPYLPIEQSGQYSIAVSGDVIGDEFRLTALRNATLENDDTAVGSPLDISNTFVDLGVGRFAVVGASAGRANASDIEEFAVDLTGHAGQSIDIVLSGLNELDLSEQQLQLFSPGYSSVLATGSAIGQGARYENFDVGILDFVVPQDGIYPVRITSAVAGNYSLIVTSGATFDTEPNGDMKDALRTLEANSVAFGYSSAGGGVTVVDDPEGDQFGQRDFQPDIDRVTALIDEDTVTLGVHFHGSFSAEDPNDVLVVLFELDVDQDPETGQPPIQSQFAGDAGQGGGQLGVDRIVQIAVSSFGSETILVDPTVGTSFTPELTQGTSFFEVEFPLSELGDDEDAFNFGSFLAVVNGQDVEATDAAPARRFATASGLSPEASGDFYQLTLTAGQTVKIQTSTPFDLPVEAPVNTLDPTLRLLSQAGEDVLAKDDNSAADGRNAVLFHTSAADETLLVHVAPEDGIGEYILSVRTVEGIPGDSNRDGRFDQLDLVQVLQAGLYLTGRPATFEQGDWNGDGVFNPLDIVTVLNSRTGPSAFAALANGPDETQSSENVDRAITTWFDSHRNLPMESRRVDDPDELDLVDSIMQRI